MTERLSVCTHTLRSTLTCFLEAWNTILKNCRLVFIFCSVKIRKSFEYNPLLMSLVPLLTSLVFRPREFPGVAKSRTRLGDLLSLPFTPCYDYQGDLLPDVCVHSAANWRLPSALTIHLYSDSDTYIYTHMYIYMCYFSDSFPLKVITKYWVSLNLRSVI